MFDYHPAVTFQQGEILRYITHGYWVDSKHIVGGPNVIYRPIPESTTQPLIAPISAILHSNAGPNKTPWASLWAYMNRKDIVGEAHFQVDGVDGDGPLVQIIPLNRRADCNYKANRWAKDGRYVGAISFESQDRGSATLATTSWSPIQLQHMIGVLTWLCVCYNVWCTQPASWTDSGIGHHSLFKEWSSFIGKTCPGAARIRQMDYIRQQVATNLTAFSKDTGWKCGKGF